MAARHTREISGRILGLREGHAARPLRRIPRRAAGDAAPQAREHDADTRGAHRLDDTRLAARSFRDGAAHKLGQPARNLDTLADLEARPAAAVARRDGGALSADTRLGRLSEGRHRAAVASLHAHRGALDRRRRLAALVASSIDAGPVADNPRRTRVEPRRRGARVVRPYAHEPAPLHAPDTRAPRLARTGDSGEPRNAVSMRMQARFGRSFRLFAESRDLDNRPGHSGAAPLGVGAALRPPAPLGARRAARRERLRPRRADEPRRHARRRLVRRARRRHTDAGGARDARRAQDAAHEPARALGHHLPRRSGEDNRGPQENACRR